MHKKKLELQIGKDSTGVSSDFNPIPTSSLLLVLPSPSPNDTTTNDYNLATDVNPRRHQHEIVIDDVDLDPIPPPNPKSTPHKRPIFPQSTTTYLPSNSITKSQVNPHFPKRLSGTKAVAIHLLHRLRHLRRLQAHIRLILLLSLPFFYFLVSHPSQSFVLDFLSALAFSTALLFSLNLGLPQLPSIRTLLTRSFPINLYSSAHSSKPPLPVFWSIGSKPKGNRRVSSGCWVQAYSNGDVYEGEFHKGKCSGWVFIGFIREMFMRVNGRMVVAMDVEFILVKMVVAMRVNSSGVLNMALVAIISEIGIHMRANILQTKCMVLECIVLQTGIDTKDLGTKEEGKDLECTHSETGKLNPGTGRMGFLMFQARRMQCVLSIIIVPKCLMRFRKHDERQRKRMMRQGKWKNE